MQQLNRGGRINDLSGRTFGLLHVRYFAGVRHNASGKSRKAMWCCKCACLPGCHDCQGAGCSIKIAGTKLVCGKAFSCGCSRTDPEVRRRAAMRVPVARRKERAQAAARKCKGTTHPPSYSLTVSRAADLLNCTTEKVIEMSREGILRTAYRGGTIKVSARDGADYIDSRAVNPKVCQMSKGGSVA